MAELKDCFPSINPQFEKNFYLVMKYVRFIGSGCLTLFSTFIVIYGVLAGESSFAISFPFLPNWFAFLLLLIMLGLLLLLEGVLVCIVDLSKHTSVSFRDDYPRAAALHAENSDEEAVMSFLIGRQILVIFTVFIAAQLTAMPNMINFPFTDTPFPTAFAAVFLKPGLLGGVVTVVYAQLMIATNYPVQFLNLPGLWLLVKFCKVFDWIGLVHLTWVISDMCCRILRLDDEVTVRLKEYDDALQHGLVVPIQQEVPGTFVQLPELNILEINGTPKFNLPIGDSEHVPQHIVFYKLYELLKDQPETKEQIHQLFFGKTEQKIE